MSSKSLGAVILDVAGLALNAVEQEVLCHPQVGGVILFGRNYQDPTQLKQLIQQIRRCHSQLLIVVDQEGGRVQRFREGLTRLPAAGRLGAQAEVFPTEALRNVRDLGWLMAQELLALGVDMSLAPVLDINKQRSSVIGDRAFANTADAVVQLAGAYIQGMAEAGMKATGKHFPGHGHVVEDSHEALPVDDRTLQQVMQQDLIPFTQLMPHLAAVMPAHIVFSEVDSFPVGFSEKWLQGILRQQMGFTGVVMSDDLSMAGAAYAGGYVDRAKMALQAGCNGLLVCNNPNAAYQVLDGLEACNTPCTHALAALKPLAMVRPERLQDSQRWQEIQERLPSLF